MAGQRPRYQVTTILVRAGDLAEGDVVREVGLVGGMWWRTVMAVVNNRIRGKAADQAAATWPELPQLLRGLDPNAVLVRLGAIFSGTVRIDTPQPRVQHTGSAGRWEVHDRYTLLEMQRLDEMYVQLYEAHLPDEDWVDE